jgi:hypothetical protein
MTSILRSKNNKFRGTRDFRGGFTIVELLVAAAITLVVLGLMVQVTFSTLQTFDRVTGTLNSKAEAQRIFDFLRRDFSSMVWRPDGKVWLLATIQPDQTGIGQASVTDANWSPINPKPSNANPSTPASSLRLQRTSGGGSAANLWQELSEYRFGQAGVWLRFFTKQPTNDLSQAATIAVAYQIVRMKPQSNNSGDRESRYLLFRSTVRPGPSSNPALPAPLLSVLSAGYTVANADDDTANGTEGCFDLTDGSLNGYNRPSATNEGTGTPGSIRRPTRDSILANNVIDFGVRFWRRELRVSGGNVFVENKLIFPAGNTNLPSNTNLGYALTSRLPPDVVFNGVNVASRAIQNRGGATSLLFATNFSSNASLNTSGETGTAGTDPVGYPDYVEVMVRILTDEGARMIAAFENGDLIAPTQSGAAPTPAEKDAYWWTLAEQHSVVYTDIIPLSARPL